MLPPADRTVQRGELLPNATVASPGQLGRRCANESPTPNQILPFDKKAKRKAGRRRKSGTRYAAGPVGEDHRERVTNTTVYPFSTVCELRMFFPTGQYAGTGVLVGPRLVLTAAHNLKNSQFGGLASAIYVYPGLNGDLNQPPLPSVQAQRKIFTTEWEQSEDDRFDYGALLLPTDLGSEVGAMAVSKHADGDLTGLGVNSASYPNDCPLVSAGQCPAQYTAMYLQHANITRVDDLHLYYTDMLLTEGCSGSPIFAYYPDQQPETQYQVLGIHTVLETVQYHATRISTQAYADIAYWQTLSPM